MINQFTIVPFGFLNLGFVCIVFVIIGFMGETIIGHFWPSSLLLHNHLVFCCKCALLICSDFDANVLVW